MSIQTTVLTSRAAAENAWVEQQLESARVGLRVAAKQLSNKVLEDSLESTYWNYQIKED